MMFVRSKHLLFCLCLLLKSFESKNNVPYWMVLLQVRLPKKFLYITNMNVSINIEVCKASIYWQQLIINYMFHLIHYKTSRGYKMRIKVYPLSIPVVPIIVFSKDILWDVRKYIFLNIVVKLTQAFATKSLILLMSVALASSFVHWKEPSSFLKKQNTEK